MKVRGNVLSEEQEYVIEAVLDGHNVLVDACIGSGKTTVLEGIYRSNTGRHILYLTYNTLLKMEAKKRLPQRKGNIITNYHGFVYPYLMKAGIGSDIESSLDAFVDGYKAGKITLNQWDLLLIDEYQDIDTSMARVLECIKDANPDIQIVAVGDMAQKISDKTTLDVSSWMHDYLGEYLLLELTTCYRISKEHADMLGRIWKKEINGVNTACVVKEITFSAALEIASHLDAKDVLCLCSKGGQGSVFLNMLEERYPEIYNKSTVYAQIREKGDSVKDTSEAAVFTTFDSSKGMERNVCFIFDYTEKYWETRATKPNVHYDILRNIFCVGASRGKDAIYIVRSAGTRVLSEATLSKSFESVGVRGCLNISEMFEYKRLELVQACYRHLVLEKLVVEDTSDIPVTDYDGFIDLTPCIGNYQEMSYFKNYPSVKILSAYLNTSEYSEKFKKVVKERIIQAKSEGASSLLKALVLAFTAFETKQTRYVYQVTQDFMVEESERKLHARLSELLNRDEEIQVSCTLDLGEDVTGVGRCDVLKDDIVYELKFVSELKHTHFLQCASYMIALDKSVGILWNTRDNTRYKITIPDRESFLNAIKRVIRG